MGITISVHEWTVLEELIESGHEYSLVSLSAHVLYVIPPKGDDVARGDTQTSGCSSSSCGAASSF